MTPEETMTIEAPTTAPEATHSSNGADSDEPGENVIEFEAPKDTSAVSESAESNDSSEASKLSKAEKKAQKKLKKQEKKRLKEEHKDKWSDTKAVASSFPMVELIAEQVRTSIPKELVERVEAAKDKKKKIISPNFPYEKCMKSEEYAEEVKLLQIELVKMQAWVKETGERIVMLFEGRDAAG